MIRNKSLMLVYFILFVATSGCYNQKQLISVENSWANPGLKGGNSAIFFEISNTTETDDNLLEVQSEVASAVEIHQTKMVDGVMKMERQFSLSVPSGEKIIFAPGDLHVMLIGLNQDLNIGDTFNATLVFENGENIRVNVLVREP